MQNRQRLYSTTTAVDCEPIKQQSPPRLLISDFLLGWGPSFISDIYSWISPPHRGLLALALVEAPAASLEKPGASDLHCLAPLVCSVWPASLPEESGPITSPCSQRRAWCHLPVHHNRLQMREQGESSNSGLGLNTECLVPLKSILIKRKLYLRTHV